MKKDVNVCSLIKVNSLSGAIILKQVCSSGTLQCVWICQGLLTPYPLAVEAESKASYSKLSKTPGKTSRRQGQTDRVSIYPKTRLVPFNKSCWEWMPRRPEERETLGHNVLGYQVLLLSWMYLPLPHSSEMGSWGPIARKIRPSLELYWVPVLLWVCSRSRLTLLMRVIGMTDVSCCLAGFVFAGVPHRNTV